VVIGREENDGEADVCVVLELLDDGASLVGLVAQDDDILLKLLEETSYLALLPRKVDGIREILH
jgi:hypothetical protein